MAVALCVVGILEGAQYELRPIQQPVARKASHRNYVHCIAIDSCVLAGVQVDSTVYRKVCSRNQRMTGGEIDALMGHPPDS